MSRARDLSRFANNQAISIDSSLNVGINSSSPDAKLDVAGIVSATEFFGDGSNLTGVSSPGLGTALSDDTTSPLNSIYFTNANLSVASTITINPPASASAAFTQYANIVLQNDADLIVADGDTFIPDILGIGTDVDEPGTLAGGAGKLRVDNITNKAGTGSPNFPFGMNVAGVMTATSFNGNGVNITGVITATSFTGDGSGLIGVASTDNIITGTAATFNTYPVDINAGVTVAGVSTFTDTVNFNTYPVDINAGVTVAGVSTFTDTVNSDSNVGVQTTFPTSSTLVGAASSLIGLYIGDGHLLFSDNLSRSGGYYIPSGLNALNAGPVTLGSTMTLDGVWVIV